MDPRSLHQRRGLGDVGILAAIRLGPHTDVVGISVKSGLVSGQELGVRLSRPDDWARDYWIPFDKFRRLDRVRTVQATLTGVDLAARTVFETPSPAIGSFTDVEITLTMRP